MLLPSRAIFILSSVLTLLHSAWSVCSRRGDVVQHTFVDNAMACVSTRAEVYGIVRRSCHQEASARTLVVRCRHQESGVAVAESNATKNMAD